MNWKRHTPPTNEVVIGIQEHDFRLKLIKTQGKAGVLKWLHIILNPTFNSLL